MSQNERERKSREQQIAEIEQRKRGYELTELNQQGVLIPDAVKDLQQAIHTRNKKKGDQAE